MQKDLISGIICKGKKEGISMKKNITLIMMCFLCCTFCACSPRYNVKSYTYYSHFNTTSTVQIVYDVNKHTSTSIDECFRQIDKILLSLDGMFNIQDETRTDETELMKVNNAAGVSSVKVSKEVIEVCSLALKLSQESKVDGIKKYDPTIGVLWKKWGFVSKAYNYQAPMVYDSLTSEEVNNLLPLVDSDNVVIDLDESTIYLKVKGMVLDLGSIVKGYACDKIKTYLESKNIEKAVINVGGNILLLGSYLDKSNNDTNWTVQIRTPFYQKLSQSQSVLGSLSLMDVSVVTSGTYEKFIMDSEGRMYHHILDPQTGYPVDNNITSVTVICEESILGDGLSTMLLTLGLENAMAYVNSHDGIEAVIVVNDGNQNKIYISNNLEGVFSFNKTLEKINYSYEGVL